MLAVCIKVVRVDDFETVAGVLQNRMCLLVMQPELLVVGSKSVVS